MSLKTYILDRMVKVPERDRHGDIILSSVFTRDATTWFTGYMYSNVTTNNINNISFRAGTTFTGIPSITHPMSNYIIFDGITGKISFNGNIGAGITINNDNSKTDNDTEQKK